MAYPKWCSTEIAVVVHCDTLRYHHKDFCEALSRGAGTTRTIEAVRSKLRELKRDGALYDSETRTWIGEGVRRRIEQMQQEEWEEMELSFERYTT